MTIAFDAKRLFYNSTGLGQYARDLVRNLIKFHPECNYRLLAQHNKASVHDEEFMPFLKLSASYPPFWRSFGIYKDIAEKEVDVYHGLSNELPFSIKDALCPSVVTIHDVIFKKYPEWYPWVDRKIYDLKTAFACKNADKIIAISDQTRQDIIEYYDVDENKIEVVYQDCSSTFSQPLSASFHTDTKVKYKLPQNFILSVGRIESRKNLMVVAQSLLSLDRDIQWVCIGRDHGEKRNIMHFLEKNHLSHRVLFLENIPQLDLVSIYRQAIALVYMSFYEGFGIPILEGMRAGVPVITSNKSSMKEVGGAHGLYVNEHAPEELADLANRLHDSKEFVQEVLDYQLNQSKFFSAEKMANETMAIYKSLINR